MKCSECGYSAAADPVGRVELARHRWQAHGLVGDSLGELQP